MKICKMCQVEKPENEFPKHGADSKYLKSHCKDCHKVYVKSLPSESKEAKKKKHRRYYLNNRTRIIARTVNYAKNNRHVSRKASNKFRAKAYVQFLEFKKTQKCAECGNNDYRCLEFHHVNPKFKEETISNIYNSTKKFQEELKKCIVLCANCHSIHHFNERMSSLKILIDVV